MSGKGSAPRPFSVSNEEYANRWDAIFNRDKRDESLQAMADDAQEKGLYDDFAQPAQYDLFCKHEIWTHNGERYQCIGCGAQSEVGPYLSR